MTGIIFRKCEECRKVYRDDEMGMLIIPKTMFHREKQKVLCNNCVKQINSGVVSL